MQNFVGMETVHPISYDIDFMCIKIPILKVSMIGGYLNLGAQSKFFSHDIRCQYGFIPITCSPVTILMDVKFLLPLRRCLKQRLGFRV